MTNLTLRKEDIMKTITNLVSACTLTAGIFTTANATIIINEVDYDQAGTDTAEFIELFNPGPGTVDLGGYVLKLMSETSDNIYRNFDLAGHALQAGGFLVICGDASAVSNCDIDSAKDTNMIQNGPSDGIALFSGTTLIDSMTYEGIIPGITEGSGGAAADKNSGVMSISRLPNGQDTNNNAADFGQGCITPGSANISSSGNCSKIAAGQVPAPPVAWLLGSGLLCMLMHSKRMTRQ